MHAFIVFLSALAASAVSATPSAEPGSVPTVTLPAASDLPSGTQSVSFSATPSGSAVAVEAGDNGDVYVSFSTDTQSKISNVYKTKCAKGQDQAACETAIRDAISSDLVQVEGRNPLAVGALLMLIVAMVMKRLEDDVNAPKLIKFNPDDYAKVSSAASQSPTALVINDGSATYTITDPLGVAPKVTTLGGDSGGSVTSSKCPTTPIICQDDECKAVASTKKTCEVESNKGCSCTNEQAIEKGQFYDTSSGSMQASILMSISSAALTSAKPAKPSCAANSNGAGPVKASPETWCVCNQSVDPAASNTLAKGVFSTISGKSGSAACDYSTMPTQTISISSSSSKVSSTTCSMITTTITSVPSGVSLTTGSTTWCTCNDGKQVGELTTSAGSQTSVYCPNDAKPTLSSAPDPKSTTSTPTSTNTKGSGITIGQATCADPAAPTFARDAASSAISVVCASAVKSAWSYSPSATLSPGDITKNSFYSGSLSQKFSDVTNGDQELAIKVDANKIGCSPGQDFSVDFKAMGQDKCVSQWMATVDGCDTNSAGKRGGVVYQDCLLWTAGMVQQ